MPHYFICLKNNVLKILTTYFATFVSVIF